MLTKNDVYSIINKPFKIYNEFQILRSFNRRDFKIRITPTTVTRTVAQSDGGYTRTVQIALVDSNGILLDQYDGDVTVATTKSSVSGTATSPVTCTLTNGVGTVAITVGGTWLADETNTLTVTMPTVLDKLCTAVAGATSVETITA